MTVRRFLGALAVLFFLQTLVAAEAGDGPRIINDRNTVWHFTNLVPDGRERFLIEEQRNAADVRAEQRLAFGHQEMIGLISDVALRHGLEPELLCAVAWTESRFRPYVTSPMGAQGLMQLMPQTARKFGVRDSMNPQESAEGGARYMRFLMEMYDNDLELALAAYNAGTGAVRKGRPLPRNLETISFVRNVLTMRDHFRNR